MRALSFFFCIFVTAGCIALYTSCYNELIELRIKAMTLEKEVKVEEAQKKRLELALEQFFNPIRLEETARKAQNAHLRSPTEKDIVEYQDLGV
jgi:hypothetical protein